MADARFFNIPFGSSGDRATIPEVVDPGGAVSYAQGFGPDYERDPATDPLAKRVPRDETNEYLYQITNGLKFLQLYGLPEWFELDGGGNPVSYPAGAQVRHDAGSGTTAWLSIAAANTAEPGTNPSKWVQASGFAWQHISAAIAAAGLTPNPSSTGQLAAAIAAMVRIELNAPGPAPVFAARAWVQFNASDTGLGPVVRGSGNIVSIVRNSVGNYTATFGTNMPDTNYAVIGSGGVPADSEQDSSVQVYSRSVSQFSFRTNDPTSNNLRDMPENSVVVFR